MANSIYVFCRAERPITYRQLEDHMGHMGFLDEAATFEPPLDASNADDPRWDSFACTYRAGRRPITVRHWNTQEEMDPTRQELRDRLEGQVRSAARDLVKHLVDSRQVFVFEMSDDLPQDVWEMLDATEVFLARTCDGIIVASDGIYDSNLKSVLSWE